MGAVVGLVVAIIIVTLVVAGATGIGSPRGFDRLVANGIPARGILLQVSRRGTKVGTVQRRFEVRSIRVDVEIPGRPPYEVTARPAIPINFVRDVLPGATVELRVDPKNRAKLVIVGPGTGFVQTTVRTA